MTTDTSPPTTTKNVIARSEHSERRGNLLVRRSESKQIDLGQNQCGQEIATLRYTALAMTIRVSNGAGNIKS